MAVLLYALSAVALAFSYLYWLSTKKFNYWKKQNVPHLEPEFIFGNYKDYILMRKFMGHVVRDICKQFPNEPYIGAYYGTEPTLIVQDPETLKLMMSKDFYYFSGREISKYTHYEVFTQNVFFTYGDRWKVIRQHFTPLFSSAKMRNMFHLIAKCAYDLEDLLPKEAKGNVEARTLMARYTMDCIGSCAFGIDTNVMAGDVKTNPFRRMGDILFEISYLRGLCIIVRSIWPAIYYGVGMKTFPKALDDFFRELITGVFRARNYENSSRNDLVDLVMSLKKQEYISGDCLSNVKTREDKRMSLKVDDELMMTQCMAFFAAGFETSSTTLGFTLFELAKNKDAQKKVAEEVDAYLLKHGNKLDYDCTKELPYLTACIDETLRLHPVLPVLTREVLDDYVLTSGAHLKKGVRIQIPLLHMHTNPDNFPDPLRFDPERFLPENLHKIKPFTYMPFGEGLRVCIGVRFSRMQVIPGLITVFKSYRVELAPGADPCMEYEPRAFTTQPRDGVNVRFLPREDTHGRVFVR